MSDYGVSMEGDKEGMFSDHLMIISQRKYPFWVMRMFPAVSKPYDSVLIFVVKLVYGSHLQFMMTFDLLLVHNVITRAKIPQMGCAKRDPRRKFEIQTKIWTECDFNIATLLRLVQRTNPIVSCCFRIFQINNTSF